jgi:hypothetical protein
MVVFGAHAARRHLVDLIHGHIGNPPQAIARDPPLAESRIAAFGDYPKRAAVSPYRQAPRTSARLQMAEKPPSTDNSTGVGS